MANYHCKISNISRGADGAGKSSIASVAYCAGQTIWNKREKKQHSYSRRWRDVYHEGIYTPQDSPEWGQKRKTFWNNIEVAERRKDARTAKQIVVSLPYELKREQFLEPILKYVQDTIISKHKIAVDVAIHRYGKAREPHRSKKQAEEVKQWQKEGLPFLADDIADKTDTPHVKMLIDWSGAIFGYKLYQPHAHITVPLREFDESTATGFAKVKNRLIDNRDQILLWRNAWQKCLNKTFERLGLAVRVSCLPKTAANDNFGGANKVDEFTYQTLETLSPDDKKTPSSKCNNPAVKALISGVNTPENLTSHLSFLEARKLAKLREQMATADLPPDSSEDATSRLFEAWGAIHDRIGGFNGLDRDKGGGR